MIEKQVEPSVGDRNSGLSGYGLLLGLGWIAIPAVQYIGAVLRTNATVTRSSAEVGAGAIDLTPWYVLLLGATLVYSVLTSIRDRSLHRQEK